MRTIRYLLESARPREWVKNLFLLAPLLFSQSLFQGEATLRAAIAFLLFCLLTSGVYVLNDIMDLKEDRAHPRKRQRPLPSGRLKASRALGFAAACLVLAIALSFALDLGFGAVALIYLGLNAVYSRWLKHLVVIDVMCIAAGFVLRVVGGALVIGVAISHWLLICTLLLALLLGFSKRRHELALLGQGSTEHRRVLGDYSTGFLDMMIGIVAGAALLSYVLYTASPETIAKFHTDMLILTIPFVIYGMFRYLYLVYHRKEGGNPAQLLADIPLVVTVLLWGLVAIAIIYWGGIP